MPSTVCIGCMKIVDQVVPESRRCLANGCHKRWMDAKNAQPAGQARRAIGKARRQRIYRRDSFRCVRCGSGKDLTIGHEPPLAEQLDPRRHYSDEELVTECGSCNSKAGATVRRSVPVESSSQEPLIA
jgi:hypothetical protein